MYRSTDKDIRVALVDDHRLMLDGLKLLIDSMDGFTCSWHCEDAVQALGLVETSPPDVLVTDITMPSRNGLELIKDVRALNKDLPVLVLSMHDESVYAQRAIKAGAKGYVMKGASNDELETALKKVVEGGIAVSAVMGEKMIEAYTTGEDITTDQGVERLSDREFEVYQLVGNCLSTSQIADQLGISPKTVDVHKSKIRAKLDLQAGSSLTAHAIRWVEVQKLAPKP